MGVARDELTAIADHLTGSKAQATCGSGSDDSSMVKKPTYEELETKIQMMEVELQQRRRAEKDLHERVAKYQLIFEKAVDAIFILREDGLKFANRRMRQMFGYTDKELKTLPIAELVHPADRQKVVSRHIRRLRGEDISATHSFRVISKAGKEIWVEDTAIRIDWEGQPASLNFVRNITERKKLDAQLQFAAKLEAIGTLAGGIAHAFNNLLMGIQGHVSLLLLDMDAAHPHYEALKKIEKEIQGGADLTGQLMGYARKGRYQARLININEIIENTSQTFGQMKKEITIHRELTPRPHAVEADRGQMEQMLFNLFINAADAMPGIGDLTLKTKNVTHRDIKSKLFEPRPGKYVRITVSDRGVGMDKEVQPRIFDPFFTTKKTGRGTGLGLASVYGIVKSHEGYINVHSRKGHGTTFLIYLPAAAKKK
jgi:two-component system cell cycle sensor histidine kinase/response regulator CckA